MQQENTYNRSLKIICTLLFVACLSDSCDLFNLERYPDLTVTNMNVSPAQVSRGNSVSASCRIENLGNGMADFPITQFEGLYYYLSSDTGLDYADVELDTENVDDLEAGKYRDFSSISLTIPAGTSPGTWYILFCIDREDDIAELDEGNNVGSYQIEVQF